MKNIFLILIGIFLLNGCAPAAITAGIAGVAASESEKGLGTTINDTIIHAAITESMFKKDVNKFLGVKIRVDDGVVLLTGKVDNPQIRVESTRISFPNNNIFAHLDRKSFKGWERNAIINKLDELGIEVRRGKQILLSE